MTYLLKHSWELENARLTTLAMMLDPKTTHRLNLLGVGAGWRCLEVGGGGGSIAQWLCQRVGPGGHVVATDLETELLQAIDEPNLEVRRHDITTDALETNTFDLYIAAPCSSICPHPPDRPRSSG